MGKRWKNERKTSSAMNGFSVGSDDAGMARISKIAKLSFEKKRREKECKMIFPPLDSNPLRTEYDKSWNSKFNDLPAVPETVGSTASVWSSLASSTSSFNGPGFEGASSKRGEGVDIFVFYSLAASLSFKLCCHTFNAWESLFKKNRLSKFEESVDSQHFPAILRCFMESRS